MLATQTDSQTAITDMSLEEIEQLVTGWLLDAEQAGKIDDLFLVARTLCEGLQPNYPHKCDPAPLRYRVQDMTVHYFSHPRPIQKFNRIIGGSFEKIHVTVGGEPPFELIDGKIVCSYLSGEPYNPLDHEYIAQHKAVLANDVERTPECNQVKVYVRGEEL